MSDYDGSTDSADHHRFGNGHAGAVLGGQGPVVAARKLAPVHRFFDGCGV